jgi:hypothetical protein
MFFGDQPIVFIFHSRTYPLCSAKKPKSEYLPQCCLTLCRFVAQFNAEYFRLTKTAGKRISTSNVSRSYPFKNEYASSCFAFVGKRRAQCLRNQLEWPSVLLRSSQLQDVERQQAIEHCPAARSVRQQAPPPARYLGTRETERSSVESQGLPRVRLPIPATSILVIRFGAIKMRAVRIITDGVADIHRIS